MFFRADTPYTLFIRVPPAEDTGPPEVDAICPAPEKPE
jgi:hypothetical protein